MTFRAADDDDALTAGAEPESGGVTACAGGPPSWAAITVPELAAIARPVSVSRFSLRKSAHISAAP